MGESTKTTAFLREKHLSDQLTISCGFMQWCLPQIGSYLSKKSLSTVIFSSNNRFGRCLVCRGNRSHENPVAQCLGWWIIFSAAKWFNVKMKRDKKIVLLWKRRLCWFWWCWSCLSIVIWRWCYRVSLVAIWTIGFPHHRCHRQAVVCASELGVNRLRSEASDRDNAKRPCFWLQTFLAGNVQELYYFHNSQAQNYASSATAQGSMCFRVLRTLKGVFADTRKISIQNTYPAWRSSCSFGFQPQTPTYNNYVSIR